MASPEEPVGKASATKPSQIQVIQEILPSINDFKEMMLANDFSGQDSAPQPFEGITGNAVNRPRNSEDLNELGDKSNTEDNLGPKDMPVESTRKNKEKRRLSSQTVVLPDQQTLSSDSSAWVSETEELQIIQPRGRSKSRGNSLSNCASQTNSKKAQKLSPARLGELLHDTPTTFSIQPSSQDQVPPLMSTITSPTRHRSITNPTTTSPNGVKGPPFARPQLSALDRTLSAPTGMRRSRSFPRALQLDTQSSPSRLPQLQQHQHGKSVEKGGNPISPQRNTIHSIKTVHSSAPSSHLSPKSASTPSARNSAPNRRDFNSPLSGHAPTTTHLLKTATPTPSSFPPLPLQTYLSLALSSPTSHAKPTTFPSPREPGPTPSTSTHYPPQHHPDDSAAIAFERITNFLLLPGKLEGALWFGMLACLDSWLYMFTILPLRDLCTVNCPTNSSRGLRSATDYALRKVLRPLGFFLLALVYNTLHSTALFYQVITLNVAVNSYSNALGTLILSVQFVEIKSTVFKKFEKESLFQLTCADVVERFQLWLMLVIIASRNLVEVGVWSLAGADSSSRSSGGVLPRSFTIFPEWTGQVMGPFLIVLGSEMLVDWLKHAYITKFNNTRPAVYERFLDVLCKDYYSHAFTDQNLTKRLGLPVIPLACLFIRASLQTYQMFLATHVPLPLPSATTSLSESDVSPVTTAALANFDAILRRALGGSPFGGSTGSSPESSSDNLFAIAMLLIFFLGFFLVCLAVKLVLGICLLTFARKRYKGMKERAGMNFMTGARKVGGFGLIDVSDDQKKWIYADDPAGERAMKERENRPLPREINLDDVKRYSMAAKRIW
ncbi:uncharacterized protein LAJ45_01770 [Morchella importuna]|uniref:uncharacterized protein n=1 Tax=Morchella importuna TaxID=1174673 RepID=UPI001E8E2301|nr:uncharacterized protein LAJ45_01770 [Morchella importuna]KAH8154003.1 hypothetical protein LAJ45_01770 [Morchella importuna]